MTVSASVEARVRASGLLAPDGAVVVLLSGGRDSVCLLDVAVRVAGSVSALHVDYGLRPSSAADAEHCEAICQALKVDLTVGHASWSGRGNLQAWARGVRYAEAGKLARSRGALVATGHTAADQVETVLYRLAASPGRRALLGMPGRDGCVVRPLLGVTREETAAYCTERGLTWREDPSNASPAYARNRVRHQLLPALRSLHPAAERNVLATLALMRDEAAVLDAAVDGALADAGGELARLAALEPALARLCLQRLADLAAPGLGSAIGARAEEILGLGAGGGSAALDLGGGLRAVVEYGRLRMEHGPAAPVPGAAAELRVPGRAAFAGGELSCEVGAGLPVGDGTLDLDALAAPLTVRAWRAGDRMRPLGLGGSRSLQDLFTDRRVPRARRARLPIVLSGGEIAWVPGVATGEGFRVTGRTRSRARLTWRPPSRPRPIDSGPNAPRRGHR